MKRVLFLLFSGLLAAFFIVAWWQDSNRGWTKYQKQFRGTLAKEEKRSAPSGIKQVIVQELGVVDRCTTCHVAIDKPQLALAEEPFTAHPGNLLKSHPVEKFGCTTCHWGQGLATEADAAHGDVMYWEKPLLRGSLVQASCFQCHGDLDAVKAHVPQLARGKEVFEAVGCFGCHAVNKFGREFGGTISQDLSEVGSKPYELITADYEMMDPPHDRIHWLLRKINHPRTLNPGVRPQDLPEGEEEVYPSAMPYYGFEAGEVEALATFMLALTDTDYPASYVRGPKPEAQPSYGSPEEKGKAVFHRFGCNGCHGLEGFGGRHNWNAGLGSEIPPLLYVKGYYEDDVESLKDVIRNGRQPTPRSDLYSPYPLLYMPSWKERISEEEIDALVAYLFSLQDKLPGKPAASAPLPAAEPAPAEVPPAPAE